MSINLRLAIKALLQNRLQAMLTLCGMSIGVAMVVIVSGLGRGAQQQIETQIESAGPTLITILPGNFRPAGIVSSGEQDSGGGEVSEGAVSASELGFDFEADNNAAVMDARQRMMAPKRDQSRAPAWPLDGDEMQMISTSIEYVRTAAGSLSGNLSVDPSAGVLARTARVVGYEEEWPQMHGWSVVSGRMLSTKEVKAGAPLMLLSRAVTERLWPNTDPLQKSLPVGGELLTVVGLIDDGEAVTSTIIVPTLYIPAALAQQLLHRDNYDQIKVRTTSVGHTTEVATSLKARLRELRGLPDDTMDDFRVETQTISAMPSMGMDPRLARSVHSNVIEFEQTAWEEMAKSLRQAGRTFTLLLSAAAAVSLLVGGIGVMNIMLVSVAARTREIGLRMALGARMKDVMLQFMVEALTLAALSGLVGLVLGYGGLLMARYGFQWATAVSPLMLVVAVIMAALTGIVFGYGPARHAASLDPVVALKSE